MTEGWQQRLQGELHELQVKLRALNQFVASGELFGQLSPRQQRLLQRQRAVMILYEDVLQERLLPLPGDG